VEAGVAYQRGVTVLKWNHLSRNQLAKAYSNAFNVSDIR
jgi:hypothetical protein